MACSRKIRVETFVTDQNGNSKAERNKSCNNSIVEINIFFKDTLQQKMCMQLFERMLYQYMHAN